MCIYIYIDSNCNYIYIYIYIYTLRVFILRIYIYIYIYVHTVYIDRQTDRERERDRETLQHEYITQEMMHIHMVKRWCGMTISLSGTPRVASSQLVKLTFGMVRKEASHGPIKSVMFLLTIPKEGSIFK